jgi:hypothetical protein
METLSMAHPRSIFAAIILASAITSRSSAAQAGSVSLTHIVSVTVPPRIRVKIGSTTTTASTIPAQRQSSTDGLSLSINATQPWSLSIGTRDDSKLQWSRDGKSGFSAVTGSESILATQALSPVTTSETIFIRPALGAPTQSAAGDDDATKTVLLTIVAQ